MSQVNGKGKDHDVRNTLGVGGQVYEQLLSRLNTDSEETNPDLRRIHTRVPFADPFIRVVIEGENGSRREMMLACRNLSRGGVGLLHSTFMYPNTRVITYLPRTDGTVPGLRGKVVRVQHRGGVVHEIGIKFEKDINPRDYLPGDFTEVVPSFERVAPDKLNGVVIFVTTSDTIRRAVKGFLLETNLNFKFVENSEQAIAAVDESPEMVFVDIEFEDSTGPELVKKLRVRGFNHPMALIGDPGSGLIRSIVKVCGADALVRTPMTQDGLLRVLGEFMLCGWDPDQLDKVRSKVDRGTLVTLCFELSKLGVVLDQQVRLEDRVSLFATCQRVRSLSMLVGMHGVASMAERLGELAAEGGSAEAMEELIEQVRLGCAAAGKAAA